MRARRALPAFAVVVVPVLIAAAAVPAAAKIAYPPSSDVPPVLVGCPSGAALPSCSDRADAPASSVAGYRVRIVDVSNTPLAFTVVTLDFSQANVRLLGDDRAGTTVDCAAKTISRTTDLDGVAVFAPRFCGSTSGDDVLVHAEGVWLRRVPARSTDVDADGTTGLQDLTRVARNLFGGSTDTSTDFDPCTAGSEGRTTLTDFVLFAAEYLRNSGAPTTVCP